jgi:cell division protein FtsL
MKGLKLRSVIGLFCLVLILAGVLVAHVWKQNAYVRLSMDLVKLGKQQAQLRNEIALLDVSVGGLKKISRIEGLAKNRFGLEYGKAPVLVYMDGDARRSPADARASGEAGRSGPAARAPGGDEGLQSGKVAWRTSGL